MYIYIYTYAHDKFFGIPASKQGIPAIDHVMEKPTQADSADSTM